MSGITRFQSGAYFTPTANTAIGTRRADYVGGSPLVSDPGACPVTTSNTACLTWVNTAAFAAAPATRRGTAGVGTIVGPNLQTWDISARKQFSINERFKLRFQADFFNIFNRANFRNPNVVVTSGLGFGTITTAGPARNIQFGLKLNF